MNFHEELLDALKGGANKLEMQDGDGRAGPSNHKPQTKKQVNSTTDAINQSCIRAIFRTSRIELVGATRNFPAIEAPPSQLVTSGFAFPLPPVATSSHVRA